MFKKKLVLIFTLPIIFGSTSLHPRRRSTKNSISSVLHMAEPDEIIQPSHQSKNAVAMNEQPIPKADFKPAIEKTITTQQDQKTVDYATKQKIAPESGDQTISLVEKKANAENKQPTAVTQHAEERVNKTKNDDQTNETNRTLSQELDALPLELSHKKKDSHAAAVKALNTLAPKQEMVEFNFENADLQNLVTQIEDIFKVSFISDEAIQPAKQGAKSIKGNKISFKTNKPLTQKEAWDLFITFLQIAGFAVVPQPQPNFYRIQSLESSLKAPIPTYIGINSDLLPATDEIIRYVYFIENSAPDSIKTIIDSLRSTSSSLIVLQDHRAFILTDKSYNIRALMTIVKELDRVTMPQAMSILKLRKVDAQQVKVLYDSLMQGEDKNQPRFLTGPRKPPTALYFPENIRLIAEPRTNALILLGSQEGIKKIEDFITKYVDVEIDQAPSPLHIFQLKFADAVTVAEIMSNVTQFGQNTAAGQTGGVRGGDKYLQPMSFTAERETNRIIVRGNYDDFLKAKTIMEQLDEPQPQVALEVLILSVTVDNIKELGTQLRSKATQGTDNFLGKNVKFQTSGLFAGHAPSGIVENTTAPLGVDRLLGNLLNLVTAAGPGNTILTLGQDIFGVWGLVQALQSITNLQVISNPFVWATNKTEALVSIGETRRVVTGQIFSGNTTADSMGSDQAMLTVKITPQINSDGMIVLDLVVDITEFTNPINFTDPTKTTKKIVTKTVVADKEVLALGGLIRNRTDDNQFQTPLLGRIPLLGWFFKNKHKENLKDNLLILISTRIIQPAETARVNEFTQERIIDYYGTLDEMHPVVEQRDPIHKLFFRDSDQQKVAENFIFKRQKRTARRKRKTESSPEESSSAITSIATPLIDEERPLNQPPAQELTKADPIKEDPYKKILDKQRQKNSSLTAALSKSPATGAQA